jgi:transcriptional regulator with XRE-family HTH domain
MNRRVKAEMALRGLSNRELARRVGVTEGWLSKVVHGRVKSPRVREAIARELGVPVKKLWSNNNRKAA